MEGSRWSFEARNVSLALLISREGSFRLSSMFWSLCTTKSILGGFVLTGVGSVRVCGGGGNSCCSSSVRGENMFIVCACSAANIVCVSVCVCVGFGWSFRIIAVSIEKEQK